ncbi:hypothetical protein Desdi_0637 [Desulfitobacterium dichloroeliminans LMG P-21439]|uniref:Protease prsW family n=1 Tax=Desulfitobacterium dichloroeliminans (strain LMG P-21439 / DCA1) TaxID=871963 RepID=L0F693_DESDL|nr:PrsW family glutamic-type intramembrane protease [Desulfitobacterium dichloroeliminans]AGA68166.1 hypothetical protein Desdi_0637 [Desulfitobacterium dichloroeliminans LMG P-21439]
MGEAIFVGTILPLAFLIIILKGENKLLMLFFTWGLIAFALSLTLNNTLVRILVIDTRELSITWAPIVEEFTKALPLGYFILRPGKTNIPFAYFGIAAGIGFSIQENYVYLFSHMTGDGSPVLFVITRSVTSCLIHAITTGMVGFGLTMTKKFDGSVWPILFGLFTLSVTIHALYNLYITSCYQNIAMLMPCVLYLMGLVVLSSKGDSKDNKV